VHHHLIMPAEPALRLATSADIPSITALIEASVRGLSFGWYDAAEIDESLVTIFGVDSQLIADGTYFVIEIDGVLAASGGWSRRATLYGGDQANTHGGADPLLDPERDAARIRAFYVSPAFARRGLGRLLYATCEAAALAGGFHRLQLGATLPGVPLYEALGFHALERRQYPMRNGLSIGVVHMERAIP